MVSGTAPTPGAALERLREIVERLRDPKAGCPWDRVQTLETLKPCLIEECYELLDKMASDDCEAHREELGDVLLQIVFQASIRAQNGDFSLADAINGVCDKLVRRHPHVFGGIRLDGAADALSNWERIKRAEGEGGRPKSPFAGVPSALPALLKAQRMQSKAARAGFEPIPKAEARESVGRALAALDSAGESECKAALGNLLFAVAALARTLDTDAESALQNACAVFAEDYCGKRSKSGGNAEE